MPITQFGVYTGVGRDFSANLGQQADNAGRPKRAVNNYHPGISTQNDRNYRNVSF